MEDRSDPGKPENYACPIDRAVILATDMDPQTLKALRPLYTDRMHEAYMVFRRDPTSCNWWALEKAMFLHQHVQLNVDPTTADYHS